MPHLQKIYQEKKDKGFEIIAINGFDPENVVTKYWNESKFSFPTVMGNPGGGRGEYAIAKAYGVRAYPTNYLIGPDGKVLWRGVGFNEQVLLKALADAGL